MPNPEHIASIIDRVIKQIEWKVFVREMNQSYFIAHNCQNSITTPELVATA